MKVAPEVPAFKREVCGDKQLMATWRTENRTVVPDAERDRARAEWEAAANLFDEGEFTGDQVLGLGHSASSINFWRKTIVFESRQTGYQTRLGRLAQNVSF